MVYQVVDRQLRLMSIGAKCPGVQLIWDIPPGSRLIFALLVYGQRKGIRPLFAWRTGCNLAYMEMMQQLRHVGLGPFLGTVTSTHTESLRST